MSSITLESIFASKGQDLVDAYYKASRKAEINRLREYNASIQVQRIWRGFVTRKWLKELHVHATDIQRVFRGHIGRIYFWNCMIQRNQERRMNFYHHQAAQIQRIWKGYHCRKTVLAYYKRKEYLSKVQRKMSNLRISLSSYHELQRKKIETQKKVQEYKELLDKASNQHHLLGTKSVPGIYNKAKGIDEGIYNKAKGIDEGIFKDNEGYKRWVSKHMTKNLKAPKIPVKDTKASLLKLAESKNSLNGSNMLYKETFESKSIYKKQKPHTLPPLNARH